jgi:uncharacterized protein (DUF58 family)
VELRRIARPGSSLFIISDFAGALESEALEHIHQLARHMEITALHCSDPLEQALPAAGHYTVTDGSQRTELYTGDIRLREAFATRFAEQLRRLQRDYGKLGIPVITASTVEPPLQRLQAFYSEKSGARR